MEEKSELHRWQNIEILGIQIPDYAAHIEMIYVPVAFVHYFTLLVCAGSLFFLLGRFLNSPLECQSSKSFKKIFTFILTPSAILSCLSGFYLYFMSAIIYGAGFNIGALLFAYAVFVCVYFMSCFHISKNVSNPSPPSPKKIYVFQTIVVTSALAIFVLTFGGYYG